VKYKIFGDGEKSVDSIILGGNVKLGRVINNKHTYEFLMRNLFC
jgi:hypothetical protein